MLSQDALAWRWPQPRLTEHAHLAELHPGCGWTASFGRREPSPGGEKLAFRRRPSLIVKRPARVPAPAEFDSPVSLRAKR